MTTFLLVRHGQSEWNAIGRWQGQLDAPLSELGRHQAASAADAIGSVDAIVASDLGRAEETAAIIAEKIGVGPVLTDPRFRERHAADWEGLTRPEIDERWPGWFDSRQRPAGFETDEALYERVAEGLHDWASSADHILVVSHGGVIMTVERELGDPVGKVPNLGGRFLDVRDGRFVLGQRTVLVDPEQVAVTVPDQQ